MSSAIEDEILLGLDLAHQLRGAGFDVIVADSGNEAVAPQDRR
jgi:DNA-binding response OmpR family regulator